MKYNDITIKKREDQDKVYLLFPKRGQILEFPSISTTNSYIFLQIMKELSLTELKEIKDSIDGEWINNYCRECMSVFDDLQKLSIKFNKNSKNREEVKKDYINKHKEVNSKPYYYEIETTTKCNYNCSYCPRGELIENTRTMNLREFEKILEKLPTETETIVFSGMGEPLLDKTIHLKTQMIKNIKSSNVKVILLTNGSLLSKEKFLKLCKSGIDEIKISLDTLDPEKYREIKGSDVNVEDVKKNLEVINDLKEFYDENVDVAVQTIISKYNSDDIQKMKDFTNELGFNFKPKLIEDWRGLIDYEEFAPPEFDLEKKEGICVQPWKGFFIHADGDISPCCYDVDRNYIVGNIFNEDLQEIINKEKMVNLRDKLIKGEGNNPLCGNCSWKKVGEGI